MKGLFCPACGSQKGPFIRGKCKKCFLKKNKLIELPKEIKIEHCGFCNRVKFGLTWAEQNEKAIIDFVKKKIKVKALDRAKISVSLSSNDGETTALVNVSGKISGTKVEAVAETVISPKEVQCDSCMRIRSEYVEAIVQARFGKEGRAGWEELLSKIVNISDELSAKNPIASIVSIEKVKNGFDVSFGSDKAAKHIVKKLSSKAVEPVKKSFKLAGTDQHGKQKRRFSYCLRF